MSRLTLTLIVCLSAVAIPAQEPVSSGAAGAVGAQLQEIGKLIDAGKIELARARLKDTVASHGANSETWFLEARLLFNERQFNESLKMLERSFALNKGDANVYLLSGQNWVVLDRLDLARPFFEQAVQLAPKDPTMHYHLGRYFYTAQRFALAERAFRSTVALDPASSKGYDNLGLALEAQHKDEEAVAAYRKAIALTEQQEIKNEWPCLNLAKFLLDRDQHEEALSLANQAHRMNPQSAQVMFVQGKALHKLGKDAQSLEALQRSIQADSGFAESHYLLGRIYLKQGRKQDAQRELELFQEIKKREEKKGGAMAPAARR